MISRRPVYSILIGMILAAGALFFLYQWRGETGGSPRSIAVDTQTVLVAATDIPFGTKLTSESIKEVAWPRDSVPAGAVLVRNELLAGPKGERIAIRSFAAGEPILRSKVSDFGEKPTLSRRVPPNMRAYSVRVSDVSGVAGFLLPGDRVDVLLTRDDSRGNVAAEVLLQNLTVLGIDQISSEDSDQPVVVKTATIQVTPEEAQKLAIGERLGTLSLALRNYADTAKPPLPKVMLDNAPAVELAPAKSVSRPARGARHASPSHPEVLVRRGMTTSVEPVAEH